MFGTVSASTRTTEMIEPSGPLCMGVGTFVADASPVSVK